MSPPPHESQSSDQRTVVRLIEVGYLLVAAGLMLLFRLHAFDLPLETDECNYAYIGARLLAGDRLYVDVWDHQPPGVFALLAGTIALFGDGPVVFRLLACGASMTTLVLLFLLLRRIAGAAPAMIGALLFAIVSSDPGTAGEGCQREIYMNALIVLAWYASALTLNAAPRRRFWLTFSAGASLGLASVFKTIVAVHWIFLALWIVWCAVARSRGARWKVKTSRIAVALLAMAIGPVILWGGTFLYFAATDRWHEFVDAVFLFNLGYSGDKSLLARLAGFFTPDRHPFIFDSAMPLWIAGGSAVLWLTFDGFFRRSVHALLILALVAAGYVTVCLPGRFWPHYYYLLIPPLVVAVSYSIARIGGWVSGDSTARWWAVPTLHVDSEPRASARADTALETESSARDRHDASALGRDRADAATLLPASVRWAIATILAATVFGGTLWTQYRDYLSQPPFGITVKRYNSRDFWGRGQGENARCVTEPDDSIFVFGNDASIYYYAQRRSASRFTMITGLSDGMPGADRRREVLMAELRENRPRLILAIEPPFPGFPEFLYEHYDEIGVDYHDRTRLRIMWIFARKDAPIEPINWDWDRSSVGGWQLGESP